jgi:hypothetical protein
MPDDLLHTLRALELALHHPGSAIQSDELESLLHPAFHEVGKSGLPYTRAQVIHHLSQHPGPTLTEAHDFQVSLVAPGCALLSYQCVHLDAPQPLHAHRTSLWLWHEGRWRLRHHQGTVSIRAD